MMVTRGWERVQGMGDGKKSVSQQAEHCSLEGGITSGVLWHSRMNIINNDVVYISK
jgi:hypothetical protein